MTIQMPGALHAGRRAFQAVQDSRIPSKQRPRTGEEKADSALVPAPLTDIASGCDGVPKISDPVHDAQCCAPRPPGRPLEMEEQERRDRILEATCCVLQEHGYYGASMDKVAHASGMSKRTLYQIYPSKRDLVRTLIATRLFIKDVPVAPGATTAAECLSSLLLNLATHILKSDCMSLIRVIVAEVETSEEIKSIIAELKYGGDDNSIQKWIRYYCLKENIDADVTALSRILFGMTIGELMLHKLCDGVPKDSWTDITKRIQVSVELFLRGLHALPKPCATSEPHTI